MDAVNKDTIDHYFCLLRDMLTTHGLLDKPSQIYNVDESGVPFNPRLPKIITAKGRGTKKMRYRSPGRKGQITIVACANAIGQAIPSMIIYDAARLNPAWTRDEVPGTGLFCNLARKKPHDRKFLSLQISYQHKQVQTDFCVHDVGTQTEECEIDLCEVVQPSLPKKSLLVSSFGMLASEFYGVHISQDFVGLALRKSGRSNVLYALAKALGRMRLKRPYRGRCTT